MWWILGFLGCWIVVVIIKELFKEHPDPDKKSTISQLNIRPVFEKDSSKIVYSKFGTIIDFFNQRYFCNKGLFLELTYGVALTHSKSTFIIIFDFQKYFLQVSITDTQFKPIMCWDCLIKPGEDSDCYRYRIINYLEKEFKEMEGYEEFYRKHITNIKAS